LRILDKFEKFLNFCEGRFCSGNVPVSLVNGENAIWSKCLWVFTVLIFVTKVTWAVGSSPLCSQYTSGWIWPWAPSL